MRRFWTLLALAMPLGGSPAFAHHAFSMFDRSRTDTIEGTVQQLEVVNPHSWLRVLVRGADGKTNEWSIEMGAPGQLQRQGWSADSVHPGDKISVMIHPLRDGSYGGQFVSATLGNGQVLGRSRFG